MLDLALAQAQKKVKVEAATRYLQKKKTAFQRKRGGERGRKGGRGGRGEQEQILNA